MKKIAVIGGGAAGLFAVKMLSKRNDVQVCLFEKTKQVGTKLRASGGGKANILNTCIKPYDYNNSDFMSCFLQKVNFETIYREFVNMGLKMCVDEENRVYPYSFFSMSVVNVLLDNLSPNIKIYCNYDVQKLTSVNEKWQINNNPILFDKVIFSTGSPANMIKKNQLGFENYLNDFQIYRKPYIPSLVGFKIKKYPQILFGCKAKAEVSLYQNNILIHKEKGEVVFKEDGVSGIVILNLSAYYNRLKHKENTLLSFNFLWNDPLYNIEGHLQKYHHFCGILHPKLNQLYLQKPFNIRDFKLEISELYGIEFAQVCSGGISLNELNDHFEFKKYPNMYAIGEMLDIDGVCGGYNLFFAFASAFETVKKMML